MIASTRIILCFRLAVSSGYSFFAASNIIQNPEFGVETPLVWRHYCDIVAIALTPWMLDTAGFIGSSVCKGSRYADALVLSALIFYLYTICVEVLEVSSSLRVDRVREKGTFRIKSISLKWWMYPPCKLKDGSFRLWDANTHFSADC